MQGDTKAETRRSCTVKSGKWLPLAGDLVEPSLSCPAKGASCARVFECVSMEVFG